MMNDERKTNEKIMVNILDRTMLFTLRIIRLYASLPRETGAQEKK